MARDSPEKELPTNHSDSDAGVSRRSFLRLGASTAAIAGLGGLGAVSRASAQTLDAVEKGADPSGNEPINDVVSSLSSGDTMTFPSGEYLVSGNLEVPADNVTLSGTDATLRFADGGLRLSGSGWTFEGFEVDFSEQDSFSVNVLEGSDWTFGNVVFRGTRGAAGNNTLLSPRVPSGSSALMHDVYAHEGAAEPGESSGSKLMWSGSDMAGSLTIRRLWGEHWAENTTYLSDAPGSITFEDCFFRNTNVAGVRGAKDVVVRGSTFVKSGPIPVQPSLNGPGTGGAVMRGIWCNMSRSDGGQFVIEDNDFHYTSASSAGPMVSIDGPGESVKLSNNRFHSSFELSAVQGGGSTSVTGSGNEISGGATASGQGGMFTRTSGEAASATPPMPKPPKEGQTPGGDDGTAKKKDSAETDDSTVSTDGTTSTDGKTLTIAGDGDATTSATFTFAVSGTLEHLTPEDAVKQPGHGVDGTTATGDVWSGEEKYRFTGDVTDFQVDGPATVSLEGQQISVQELLSSTSSGSTSDGTTSDSLTNTIVVNGTGPETTYSFTVSGDLQKHETLGSQNAGDVVDGSTATGAVYGGVDAYRYSGELESIDLSGYAVVQLRDDN
ncbi:hypothetical protein [Halobacterium zhouii]|uniref:hypothetical protein n=1 Tax=Halobacterium zhouii TaxID=2902624 RepID=UPI001E4B9588|nr:hypothetical protein [Halobacterium zhouii]